MKNLNTKECEKQYKELKQRLSENSDVNHLVFHVFAGHGWQRDGLQRLLINEFDVKQKTYKDFPAEECIRKISSDCKNSYNVGIFACCRQGYDNMNSFMSKKDVQQFYTDELEKLHGRQLLSGERIDEEKVSSHNSGRNSDSECSESSESATEQPVSSLKKGPEASLLSVKITDENDNQSSAVEIVKTDDSLSHSED